MNLLMINSLTLFLFPQKASFGGLLGLFVGFSFITGFELIYFFTLRVVFDKMAQRKVKPAKQGK